MRARNSGSTSEEHDMSIHLGVVMDPIEKIHPHKDTTLALLLEAQTRDWAIDVISPSDLYYQDGSVRAPARRVFLVHRAGSPGRYPRRRVRLFR